MVATHIPCNSQIRFISVHWLDREPVFFVAERKCATCPECREPLTFGTLADPRADKLYYSDLGEAPHETRSLTFGL